MKGIIHEEIMSYLSQRQILDKRQLGFLPSKLTQLQLFNTTDQWTDNMDQGKDTVVTYLDFRKKIESVPHRRLHAVMKAIGFSENTFNWIQYFLTGSKQRVVVNVTTWCDVLSGIPQESVLGQILFIMHTNIIGENLKSNILLFVADAKL